MISHLQPIFWAGLALAVGGFPAISPSQAQSGVVVIGTLTEEGVECPAMRGDDGKLYTLTPADATTGVGPGDRVRVEGTLAEFSFCQQGTTISVSRVEGVAGERAPGKAKKGQQQGKGQLRKMPAPSVLP